MTNSNIFYERLNKAIKESGKSANQVERELGYSRNALSNYRVGRTPSARRLIELAEYFQVSPMYLIGYLSDNSPNDVRNYFEHLRENQKFEILMMAQEWVYDKFLNTTKKK
jgi:transcriptional regulator with XRE-family HTH domain